MISRDLLQPASLILIAAITIATTIALRSAYNWYHSSRSNGNKKVTLDPNKKVPVTLMEKEVCHPHGNTLWYHNLYICNCVTIYVTSCVTVYTTSVAVYVASCVATCVTVC